MDMQDILTVVVGFGFRMMGRGIKIVNKNCHRHRTIRLIYLCQSSYNGCGWLTAAEYSENSDIGTPTTGQPYKFGGKELITANGLNEYDFGARQYYSAVPSFTKPDPLCEELHHLSPYLYCANNPVNLV